jgi:hypothetical protein
LRGEPVVLGHRHRPLILVLPLSGGNHVCCGEHNRLPNSGAIHQPEIFRSRPHPERIGSSGSFAA